MHACGTPAVILMSDFDDFYNSLQELVKSHTKDGTLIKVEPDLREGIIRIFGEHMSSLGRAKSGLEDMSELAYTTAEHHPYWNLLYSACQIAKITLDKWDSELTPEELSEITWSIDELKNTCQKIIERPNNDHTH